MHQRARPLVLVFLLAVVAAVAVFFLLRGRGEAAYGPAVALCPGPDQYGYLCGSGTAFAYIDATVDTRLYEDDGIVQLSLPFPFTFYGTTYNEITAGSNGTLQFQTEATAWSNDCLAEGPLAEMGDLIAPYWDDLDLRLYGYLETEVVGEAPNRIFVIEWDDIPRYGTDTDDRVTFEVQLFESNHDIVVLYQDVTTNDGNNGREATIGIQSASQGRALQYSCDQPTIADASGILFDHPDEPNEELPAETALVPAGDGPVAKGDLAHLLTQLQLNGPAALPELNQLWFNQSPPRRLEWRWSDLTGGNREELVLLWYGPSAHPQLSRLAVVTPPVAQDDEGVVLFDGLLMSREVPFTRPVLVDLADVTADGLADVIVRDDATGNLIVVRQTEAMPWSSTLLTADCQGSVAIRDGDGDGQADLIRENCNGRGRLVYKWDGSQFIPLDS